MVPRHSLTTIRVAFTASLLATVGAAQTHDPRALASADSNGIVGDSNSSVSAISADGRFVAMASGATNLVVGDTNGVPDVFVHDRIGGATVRVSVDSSGAEANGESRNAVLSADGRFVAFESVASNLVAGDTNGSKDVFLHDRDPDGNGIFDEGNGVTTRVSVDSTGIEANQQSEMPSISEDGSLVAFSSSASNLVAGDKNRFADVFVHDLATGVTTRVSLGNGGQEGNGNSQYPSLSANGRYVAFQSEASNLVGSDTNQTTDVFVRNLATGVTRRASVDSNGVESDGWNGSPVVSRDGKRVMFHSTADNLDARKTGKGTQVYLRDVGAKTTELVSVDSNGVVANGDSLLPALTADGRFAAFTSAATNLDPIAFDGGSNVYLRDLQAGTTTIVSRTCFATSAGGASGSFTISGDGNVVAFHSNSADLSSADENIYLDVYGYDRSIPEPIASSNGYGAGYPGTFGIPSLASTAAPVFGSSLALTIGNSLGQWTATVLAVGSAQASIPTRAGGTLLVAAPTFFVEALPPGGLSIPWSVPLTPALCGVQVDLQALEFDAGARYGISFTPGLEWVVGN